MDFTKEFSDCSLFDIELFIFFIFWKLWMNHFCYISTVQLLQNCSAQNKKQNRKRKKKKKSFIKVQMKLVKDLV